MATQNKPAIQWAFTSNLMGGNKNFSAHYYPTSIYGYFTDHQKLQNPELAIGFLVVTNARTNHQLGNDWLTISQRKTNENLRACVRRK